LTDLEDFDRSRHSADGHQSTLTVGDDLKANRTRINAVRLLSKSNQSIQRDNNIDISEKNE